ncbi:MAG: LacI family DNA-binding transcriptional regulator [Lachnospiraceae bacterium]|nr:LacI family DNA-binding transcriptional regulator [Lachnospiraceae bacterium]
MEITIKDVAKICGVGVSTVSRAINNHPDINQETKDRIMQVIKENNYIPNNSARNLKRSEANTIAVLIKGITNPFFAKMTQILEEEIQKKRYSFVLHRVEDKEDEVDVAVELIKEKRLKGIIFLGGFFSHSHEKLKELTVPFVLSTVGILDAGGKPEGKTEAEFSSVSVDDFEESYKMVDYLCRLGHKDILILASCEDDESIGALRLEGYKRALQDHGLPFKKENCIYMDEKIETYSMENGYVCMKKALEKKLPVTAVYAVSDSTAIGACRALAEAGMRIPEDVSVAGFDGLDIGQYYMPSLTTIRQPVEEMAYATSRLLFDLIKKKSCHQQLIFPAELIARESTREV